MGIKEHLKEISSSRFRILTDFLPAKFSYATRSGIPKSLRGVMACPPYVSRHPVSIPFLPSLGYILASIPNYSVSLEPSRLAAWKRVERRL